MTRPALEARTNAAFHKLMDDLHIGNSYQKVRDAEIIWDAAIRALSAERGEAVAQIIHSPDALTQMVLLQAGIPIGYGTHNLYLHPPSPSADSFALMQQALFALWQAPNDYAARATAQTWLRPEDLAAYKAAQPAASAAPSGVSDAEMARALEAARAGLAPEHVVAIAEAIAAYDPATAGARTARQPQPGRVEGMVLVPREPTPAMVEAICRAHAYKPSAWPDGYGKESQIIRRANAESGHLAMIEAAGNQGAGS